MTINDVLTLEEAAELWGKTTDSLRQACIERNGKPPRFKIGIEARQSKRIWLVTYEGMQRLYGKIKLNKEDYMGNTIIDNRIGSVVNDLFDDLIGLDVGFKRGKELYLSKNGERHRNRTLYELWYLDKILFEPEDFESRKDDDYYYIYIKYKGKTKGILKKDRKDFKTEWLLSEDNGVVKVDNIKIIFHYVKALNYNE